MAVLLSFAFVLVTFSGCLEAHASQSYYSSSQGHLFARASLSNVVDSKDIVSNLKTMQKSSFLKNVIPDSISSFADMLKLSSLFEFHTAEKSGDTDHVQIVIHPFKVVLRSVREDMPKTTMNFDYNNYTIPINREARHHSPYTPISLLYRQPRMYSGDVPTLEEVYDNPRSIKGFERAHAHPANREVVMRIVEIGKNALQVIRHIPQRRALEEGEPGIPIEVSEMPMTIVRHPYGDSTIVFPASKIMIPHTAII